MEYKELKAESILSLQNLQDFIVEMDSTFKRNYSPDFLSNKTTQKDSEEIREIKLSRDGIFHILPQGLFFSKDELSKMDNFKEDYKIFEKKVKNIKSFFQPFDTEYFKLSLKLEKQLNKFTEKGNNIFMEFIDYLLEESYKDSNNKYIYRAKRLLPFANQIRGNIPLLKEILKEIVDVRKVDVENELFIFHKEGLSKEEYLKMNKELSNFFTFFAEWFLPVDVDYDYRIKDRKREFKLGENLILDYNTNL